MGNKIILLLCLFTATLFSQQDSTNLKQVEIYVIDSFISPEPPYIFTVSFFTSDSCTSRLIIDNKMEYDVSKKLDMSHKAEINISDLFNKKSINYRIIVKDKFNNEYLSQEYELEIPQNLVNNYKKNYGLLQICCISGVIFGIPSPNFVLKNNKSYFSLSKEIPLFSFFLRSYNYPFGYIGLEYSHIFNAEKKNFLRIGYKQIIQLNLIKYASFGVNHFTDLKGYNGISPEISLGLFNIQNVFTFYVRYRYNFQLKLRESDFHEISAGLYSNFFSINF
ncbi:MAG: hypothetical protein N2249_01315 [Melioribacter sp.]|nr:hypothetical protein [Melioribacter sp.]